MKNLNIAKKIIKIFLALELINIGACYSLKTAFAAVKQEDVKQNLKNNDLNFRIKADYKKNSELGLNAKCGAILLDASNGDILFSKNCDSVGQMASTTKIMTALITLENYKKLGINIDRKEEVHLEAIDNLAGSSLMGLKKGDMVSLRGLLYGMLLMSGNDAANEIAVRIAGSIPKFIEMMNEKALELGLKHTTFSSPSGLGEEDVVYIEGKKNRTTARELSTIALQAFKHPLFKKIVSTSVITPKYSRMMWNSTSKELTKDGPWICNTNKLLKKNNSFYYNCANGIKTGFTRKAGRCLVGSAKKGNAEVVSVVLNDPADWEETTEILKYGLSLFKTTNLSDYVAKDKIKDVVLTWSGDRDIKFKIKTKEPAVFDIRKDLLGKVDCKMRVDPIYITKLKEGEEVGEVEFYLKDKLISKTQLISDFSL